MSLDNWGVLTIILSFAMSFSIGSNDAANGLATSYGSKALSLRKLIAIGAVAEFIGAMFCSDKVAATLSRDIVPDLPILEVPVQKRMMFSVCLASFGFIMTSSFSGMPISGTHTVVGALLGAGIIATGFTNLNWTKLGYIVLSWFVSPALAAFITFILMVLVAKFTMNTAKYSFRTRILSLQGLSAICFVIIAALLLRLTGLEYKMTPSKLVSWQTTAWEIGFYVFPFLAGLAAVRIVILATLIYNSFRTFTGSQIVGLMLVAVLLPLSTNFIEKLTHQIELPEFEGEVWYQNSKEIAIEDQYQKIRQTLKKVGQHPQAPFSQGGPRTSFMATEIPVQTQINEFTEELLAN